MMKIRTHQSLFLATVVSIAACAGQPEGVVPVEDLTEEANQAYADKQAKAGGGARTPQGQTAAAGNDARRTIDELTKSFADEVAARTADTRGRIAVFPPFVRNSAANRWMVADLSDRIAEEVALRLRAAGREVLAGDALRAAIERANRGLDSVTDEAGAQAMARRLSGLFFVGATTTGSIDVTNGGFSEPTRVSFRLRAMTTANSAAIVSKDLRLDDPQQAATTARELERAGKWRIGADADRFNPTVDREFDVLATAALARIYDQAPQLLRNRRVAVMPVETAATAASARKLAAMQQAIGKAIDAAERRAQSAGKSDPLQVALDEPLQVGGRQYASGTEALMDYQQKRAAVFGTRGGALAKDLAAALGETIRALVGEQVEIIAADDRRAAVSMVKADMLEFQSDHSIDPGTIGEVRGNAPDVLVRTKVSRRIETYVLTIRVFDLANPNRGRTESMELPSWMVGPIRNALGS